MPSLTASTIRTAKGNVTQETKDALSRWYSGAIGSQGFAREVSARLEATELSVYDKPEESGKKEAKVVFEIDVKDDMCNFGNNMHGGCAAFLIDLCSSVALTLLASQTAPDKLSHVSLVLNTIYHAPAPKGCRLKIVNTTVALGGRVMTARTEIFDKTKNRLAVSGVHLKMAPSPPKL
ncbi:hypothetical protein NM688_g5083 [Phlebia brevispora]|uniref:Uncharacterized protein n=1 Tax=Phlebia brevispora TaxID=194682 RepID=A0ACC1T1C6_9APHY|nr:hypothetical protein NM688_g5083 [Phlebia brevispora]